MSDFLVGEELLNCILTKFNDVFKCFRKLRGESLFLALGQLAKLS